MGLTFFSFFSFLLLLEQDGVWSLSLDFSRFSFLRGNLKALIRLVDFEGLLERMKMMIDEEVFMESTHFVSSSSGELSPPANVA